MIIAKTKLKNIPESCTKCKFSEVTYDRNWNGWHSTEYRTCSLTNTRVPYVFIKERKNWCYTKCKNCPLVVTDDHMSHGKIEHAF